MSERAQALADMAHEIAWMLSDIPADTSPVRDIGIDPAILRRWLAVVQAPAEGVSPPPDEQLCDGCLCSGEACAAYRKSGKICCPDCDHMRRSQPDEKGHLPTCRSWRCAWE